MTFALSHRSLAQFWHNARLIEGAVNTENELLIEDAARNGCHTRSQARPLPPQAASVLAAQPRITPSADTKLSHKRSELQAFARTHNLDIPLDLMVFTQERRKNLASSHCRLTSLAGVASLIKYGEVLIGVPELCLLQIGPSLSAVELTRCVYELCSTYVLSHANSRGFATCKPLIEPNACLRFLSQTGKRRGMKRLRSLLESIPEGHSASPRETALSMMLALPTSLGGYGMTPTKLNARIELGKTARGVYGKGSCVCDLLFGAVDIEYDSNLEHESVRSSINDSLRSTALAFEGIEVLHVYAENTKSLDRMDALAMLLAAKLGHRLELDQSKEARSKRETLRQQLFQPHRPLFQLSRT